nr:MAG TPA: hypothetical protein [Caudoviricetes sp.]
MRTFCGLFTPRHSPKTQNRTGTHSHPDANPYM